jgi:hypothetical protein
MEPEPMKIARRGLMVTSAGGPKAWNFEFLLQSMWRLARQGRLGPPRRGGLVSKSSPRRGKLDFECSHAGHASFGTMKSHTWGAAHGSRIGNFLAMHRFVAGIDPC